MYSLGSVRLEKCCRYHGDSFGVFGRRSSSDSSLTVCVDVSRSSSLVAVGSAGSTMRPRSEGSLQRSASQFRTSLALPVNHVKIVFMHINPQTMPKQGPEAFL